MPTVLYEVVNNIAKITLNNPKKRNMLDLAVCRLLVNFIKEAEPDRNVLSVISSGAGSIFCARAPLYKIKPDKDKLKTI
jgi:enoyl-CoA hydratase